VYYGERVKMEDGDLFVLAGVAPYQFRSIEYGSLQFTELRLVDMPPPAAAWGVVIDGTNRKFNYLTQNRTMLSLAADGTLTVSPAGAQKPLLLVERGSDGTLAPFAITVAANVETLWAQFKEGDYTFVACRVPAEKPVEVMNTVELLRAEKCKILRSREYLEQPEIRDQSLSGVPFEYGDLHFEIVAFPTAAR
jgi:hypothetical protein